MFGQQQTITDNKGLQRNVEDLSQYSLVIGLEPDIEQVEVVFGCFADVYEVDGYFITTSQEILTPAGPKRMGNIYQDGDAVLRFNDGRLIEAKLGVPHRLGRKECYQLTFQRDAVYKIDTYGLAFQGRGVCTYGEQGQDGHNL